MPVTTTVHVDGLRQLGEAMRELSQDIALKVAAQATAAGAQVVKKQYKRNLIANPSIDTGLVEKNIIVKKLPKSQTQLTAEHVVTVRKKVYPANSEQGKRNSRKVASFLEFGTVRMKPEPGLASAFRSQKEVAAKAIEDKLRKRIEAVKPK